MKKTGIFCVIAAVVFIASGPAIPLFADDKDNEATIDMLTSGDWHFSGVHWSNNRTFYRNGTMLEHGHSPNAPVPWKISGNKIIIEFDDYEDTLLLPLDPKGTKGIDRFGLEFTATKIVSNGGGDDEQPATGQAAFGAANQPPGGAPAEIPPAATVAPEMQEKAAEIVKAYHDSLLVVTGKGGAGSGFLAAMSGTNYIVTNAHVMAAIREPVFKSLDDTAVPGGAGSVAVGADLFRQETKGGKPFEILENAEQNAAIGDDVAVLGNAEGAGVVNTIMGKITGIGPSLVEIDAQFVPGNSGSPIIHLKSGKVIAIATFLSRKEYDPAIRDKVKAPVTRYFGYRLDNVKAWQPVNWPAFYAQAGALDKLHAFSLDLEAFYKDLWKNGRATAGGNGNPVLKDHIDEWIKDRQNLNADDARRSDEMFVSFLKNVSQEDLTAAQPYLTYDYFQRLLVEERQYRAGIYTDFEKLILHTQ